jgi:uncharacterized MAPEG superfamily protein
MLFTTALAALAFLTIALVGMDIMYTYYRKGFAFGFSSNRAPYDPDPFGLRIKRTLQNQVESSAYTIPVLAGAALMGLDAPGLQAAAAILVFGRIGFAVMYYTGLPYMRVPFFVMGTLGALYIGLFVVGALHAG